MNQNVASKPSSVWDLSPAQRVQRAVCSLKRGNGVVVCDDFNRENEGDLIFPAQTLSCAQMAMLIRECSGIVCLCITPKRATQLGLSMMVENNRSSYKTAFTVSIEAASGVTTGVSAKDRVATIQAATADNASSGDVVSPGHVFPLVARPQGVLERMGHTEATVDLMRLADLKPCGVLCELTNADGTMMKGCEITSFAQAHDLPVCLVEDIARVRTAAGVTTF